MSHWPVINLLDFPSYKHLRVLHDTVALFFQLPFCPAPEGLWLSCTAFPEPALHSFLFVTRVAPKQPTEVNVVPEEDPLVRGEWPRIQDEQPGLLLLF